MDNSKKNISKLAKKLVTLVMTSIGLLLGVIATSIFTASTSQFNKLTNQQVELAIESTSHTLINWFEGFEVVFKSIGEDKQFIEGVKNLNNSSIKINGSIKNKDVDESILYVQSKLESLYKHGNGTISYAYVGTPKNQFQQAPAEELDSTFKCSEREWYSNIVNSKSYQISKPYSDYLLQSPCISIGYPIEENGKIIGVIVVDILLNSISDKINSYNVGEDGFIGFLMEEDGKYKSIFNSNTALNKLINNKFIVNSIEDESTEYKITGLPEIISNTKTKDELLKENDELKLSKIKINDSKYNVSVVKDEHLDIYQIIGVSTKEINAPLIALTSLLIIEGVIFGSTCSFSLSYILKTTADSINNIGSVVNNIKNKELNKKVEGKGLSSKDEIGELSNNVNFMIDSLTDMVRDITTASSSLNISSQELSTLISNAVNSINDISVSMENITTASTEQTIHSQLCTSLSSELSDKLDNAAASSQEMKSLAKDVVDNNKKGSDAVSKLQTSTIDTNNATSNIETTILNLEQKTETINSIVETISNISEQTNLLAINASIESARAGDAGRGFAIVADEVKKLAEQSHTEANRIRYIIEGIKLDVHEAVLNAKDVRQIVSIQNNSVIDVNNSFNEISSSIDKINNVISHVTQVISDVNSDKESIVKALELMTSLNQETSASCEEVYSSTEHQVETFQKLSKASNDLYDLSIKLNELTNQFKF